MFDEGVQWNTLVACGIDGRSRGNTYCNEDVHFANKSIAKPSSTVEESEQREEEWHELHTSCSDHHALHNMVEWKTNTILQELHQSKLVI
jgi:hypothetical protein